MMKKLFLLLFILPLLLTIFILKSSPAMAYSNNRLIDGVIFDNTNTMNAAQIDAWLNTFSGSCISTNSGFSASEPTGYTPLSSNISGKYSYGAPVSAGTIIY